MSQNEYLLQDNDESDKKFDFKDFIEANKVSVVFVLLGLILTGLGLFLYKDSLDGKNDQLVVLESATEGINNNKIIVEIVGAVEKPGVYEFDQGDRIEDVLIAAGGLSANASREWVEKNINRASKLTDGAKIYIYSIEETAVAGAKNTGEDGGSSRGTTTSTFSGGEPIEKININTASSKELESLWGIGPVTAQNIIEQRPYSTIEELLERKLIKSNVYERNKELLTVY